MIHPKISIITVCYNSAATIGQTIHSVLSQDYPNIEYIIIDGASTDGTLGIISAFQGKCLVVSEPDQGIYDAMNKGIAKATGDVVALLNADDIYADSQVVSKVMATLADDNVDACYGDLIYFAANNPAHILRYWRSSPFRPGLFAKGWCPPHPTFFVKKRIYEKYGRFNTNYIMGNDVEFMMRLLEKHQIRTRYLPEILVHMRAGGVSNRQFGNIITQNKAVLAAAKALEIPISPFFFFLHKLCNRIGQFLLRPKRENNHAKS